LSKNANFRSADLHKIVAQQKALGKRLIWLLAIPFVITAILAAMFISLNTRIADVEVAMKIVTIERYLLTDKNYRGAVDEYETIARTYTSAPIFARLGLLYFQLDPKNNKEIAIQKLTSAKNVDPAYWETYRNLAFIYTSNEQAKEAIDAGKKALALNKNDANTYNNLAWVYATSKEPEFRNMVLAQEYAEKAVALTKDKQPHFLDTLAQVHFEKGGESSQAQALIYLRKAIAISPRPDRQIFKARFTTLFPSEKP